MTFQPEREERTTPAGGLPLFPAEPRCHKLLAAASDYTYTVRVADGRPSGTLHSPASTAVTGYAPEEYEQNPYLWFEMIHPDDREAVRGQIDRVLDGADIPPFEHRILHKSGAVRWLRNTMVPFHDAEGRLTEYDALVTDVTETRHAAAQVARANRSYKTLSLCNRALIRARDEKKFLTAICRLLASEGGYAMAWVGYPRHEAPESVSLAAADGRDHEALRRLRSNWAAKGDGFLEPAPTAIRTGRVALPKGGNDHGWAGQEESARLAAISFPLKAEQETLGALTLYSREEHAFTLQEIKLLTELAADLAFGITVLRARKKHARAEKMRVANQVRLQAIFDTVQAGILLIDLESRQIADANRAACQMIGLPRKRIVGRRCHNFICRANRGECPIIDLGQRCDNLVTTLLQADGSELPIMKSVAEVEFGGRTFLLSSFLDITQRVRAEEGQRSLQAQLRHAQKMEAIGTLAGGIAHDFNNILHAILGYAGLLQHTLPEGSEQHQFSQAIQEAGVTAAALIRQILSFSRWNAEERNPLQLQYLIKEALKLLRATLPATIEIRQEVDTKCPPVLADSSEIHQIIMNLGTNAFHAMREQGGTLTVRLAAVEVAAGEKKNGGAPLAAGTYVQLAVSDTGHGMNEATMARIFEPYFTTKSKEEGTGLGLAIVHGIVTGYGGTIAVESAPDHGATFVLRFPALDGANPTAGKEKQEVALVRASGRALVVDDVKLNVALGEYLLKRLGWEVAGCTDSRDALGLFSADPSRFDLVITDQTMPHLTGTALTARLLAIRPDLPIIMATGYSELVDEAKAMAAGVRKFLTKPMDRTTLIRAMNEIFPTPG